MKKMKKKNLGRIIYFVGIILLVIWSGVRVYNYVQFGRNCEGYLKRAADASSIERAREELEKVIVYAEKNGLTKGYTTAILWTEPSEDIGFWYENLKTAYKQLEKSNTETISDLEESNLLMKLREVVLDQEGNGNSVTLPGGISIFPHNTILAWLCIIGLIVSVVGYILKEVEKHRRNQPSLDDKMQTPYQPKTSFQKRLQVLQKETQENLRKQQRERRGIKK